MTRTACNVFIKSAILLGLAALPGCGYTLHGKVVQGQTSGVELIHQIDERLQGAGLANVEVRVRRDPNTPHSHLAGHGRTAADGDFAIHIDEFGTGWMDEPWLVQARMGGYQNAEILTKLPGKGGKWRLLITLAPGTATPLEGTADYMQDFEQFR